MPSFDRLISDQTFQGHGIARRYQQDNVWTAKVLELVGTFYSRSSFFAYVDGASGNFSHAHILQHNLKS